MNRLQFPSFIKSGLRVVYYVITVGRAFFADYVSFLVQSRTIRKLNTREKFEAVILMKCHNIEKGLSLANTRPGFGKATVHNLIKHVVQYESRYGVDRITTIARNCLKAYFDFNEAHGARDNALYREFQQLLTITSHEPGNVPEGGVVDVSRSEIQNAAKGDFAALVMSRHSIRQFSPNKVTVNLFNQAVRLAQQSPSVCNRQSGKVHAFFDEELKRDILALQKGNQGFGDQAGVVIVVTADLQSFAGAGERNQCWADGGMFAMSLVYALHFLGLGACCLNWCVSPVHNRQLRKIARIPTNEAVIMLIVTGHLPERLKVTHSPRKPLHAVLNVR